ncbi:sigma factor-like helix-turn-helix DNA-binding protein [Streptomyces sp. WMMC500]|uniref:sigma factor-like helix-turn-helix DNA-binding protein n=1 Tax=Streptomyces sp. WMMC500 TaxID=3015154 RepID=UPI00248B2D82|nr:sigma factor-like helix-turn-helix DNA-binding protein [Streptomyces sp. WMMC500]WBB61412.1 sigma factor-like helix-turn-helix DNA-binding protein [Streptomyces sp. WMMC500]
MDEREFLALSFEEQRPHLRAVAHRVLGSAELAEEAVREAWLRVSRAEPDVEGVGGWLRTVVGEASLDILRARAARREDSPGPAANPMNTTVSSAKRTVGDSEPAGSAGPGPRREGFRGDSVGIALLAVLDSMTPAERLAFVMHDLFAVPYDEIAPIVRRSPTATRQLALRARRHMQGPPAGRADDARRTGGAPGAHSADFSAPSAAAVTDATADWGVTARWSAIAGAFLTASRGEDFHTLLALLDPDVVLRADAAAVAAGAAEEVRGAVAVADVFTGRLRAARLALVDGAPGLVWMHQGRPRIAFAFAFADGTIVAIDVIADPDRLRRLRLQPFEG